MRQKMDNWQRIDSVIRWANMTINYFALYIGLPRGENLYQIKREIMVFPGTWPTRSWPNSRKSAWRGCLPARGRCLWTRNYAGCKFRFIRWMSNPISPVLTSWPPIGRWWFPNWPAATWLCCIMERLWGVLFRPDRSCSWKNDARGDYSRTRIRDCLSKNHNFADSSHFGAGFRMAVGCCGPGKFRRYFRQGFRYRAGISGRGQVGN